MPLLSTLRFTQRAGQLGRAMRWSPKRLARVQDRRFRRLLRIAAKHSPFYRQKFAGLDPRRARLAELPITTKEEIRENFDRVVTRPELNHRLAEEFLADERNLGRWLLGRYAVSHTSGSQGPPLVIVQDRRSIEIIFAAMSARASTHVQPGIVEGIRRWRRPKRIAIVTFRRGFYPSGASLEYMEEIMGPFVRVLRLSSTQPDVVEQLRRFQPHVLVGFSSVLDALVQYADELQLRELRQITNTSEQLLESARKRIQNAFGVPVCDHYGIGECLHLSDSCASHRNIHINFDWAILESVDDQNRPVEPGTVGAKVLVTNLVNFVQPFIRYEVRDRLALASRPCACGNRLPLIERIEGRSSDVFWVRQDEKKQMLPGILFHHAVDSVRAVREWQAIQTGERNIELLLEALPDDPLDRSQLEPRIIASLKEAGLPSYVDVRCNLVKTLSANATTGKMQRMIVRTAGS